MYRIIYHKLVLDKDFKKISRYDQNTIVRAIHNKLTIDPFAFGKPLTKSLKGFYRLRVNKFRVVYKIKREEIVVFIFQVGPRKNSLIYVEAVKRLRSI